MLGAASASTWGDLFVYGDESVGLGESQRRLVVGTIDLTDDVDGSVLRGSRV